QRLVRDAPFGLFQMLFFQSGDLLLRQEGEEFEIANHVAVIDSNPKLVEAIDAGLARVDPDCARDRLAEFASIGIGDQRQSQAEDMRAQFLAAKIAARRDIAPPIAAADPQLAI